MAVALLAPLVRVLAPQARAEIDPVLARWSARRERLMVRSAGQCSKPAIARIERRLARAWDGNESRAISDAARLAAARARLDALADRARAAWSAARTSAEEDTLHALRVRCWDRGRRS